MAEKFINLETGYVFDGNQPYVFWFDKGQSTDIIYSKHIAILSDKQKLNISIPENDVFSLLNINVLQNEIEINGVKYYDLNTNRFKCNSYESTGESYNNKFIHIIYFCANSNEAGEFIEEFKIGDTSYNIGADFYTENESLYINLSNFGVEIPESIQKAIYESNVHEDKKDNILINRKFKELLVNYWDIIANRGSYKSLINSLKWFEWGDLGGDLVQLREIWKRETPNKTIYEDRELSSIMSDKYLHTLSSYAKTTYYALYLSKENILSTLDSEKNPEIKFKEFKWPIIDIMIKMSLLGHFYETYFMPIHLDLIHSTIEDVVFTNTIKVEKGTTVGRVDNIYNFENIICNIKDGDEFILGNVSCQVNNDTSLGTKWNDESDYKHIYILGVDDIVNTVKNDQDARTFYSQLYNGVGVVIPIKLSIPLSQNDFIKSQYITLIHDKKEDKKENWETFNQYRIYKPSKDNYVHIDFNLLCTKEREYDIRLQFESATSKVFTKRIVFKTIDEYIPTINLYKVKAKPSPLQTDLYDENGILNTTPLLYNAISRQPGKLFTGIETYTQFINGGDVKFNHMLILTESQESQIQQNNLNDYFRLNLSKHIKEEPSSTAESTIIYISKKYIGDDGFEKYEPTSYIKSKDIFVPQFHYIESFGGDTLDSYSINDNNTLCCVPDLRYGYRLKLEEAEWIFENVSTGEIITLNSIQQPMILNSTPTNLSSGFYNVIFRYSLVDGKTNEIKLNSVFLKK